MIGLALALGFLGGMLLHDSGGGTILVFPIIASAVLCAVLLDGWRMRAVVVTTLILLALGALRGHQSATASTPVITTVVGSDGAVEATVQSAPTRSAARTEVTIKLVAPPHATISASLPPFPDVHEGDVIEFWAPASWSTGLSGHVRLPISPQSNALFVPSYAVVGMSSSRSAKVRRRIDSFVTRSVTRHVPEPSGSLTMGVLTGDDSGMTDATRASFRSAGMSHITAVSGWNVAVVAGLIALIARRLTVRRSVAVLGGLAMIWSYVFIVGMEPSALRAAGMASIFLLAQWRGRPGDLLTALLITTAVLVAITPAIRFDIGFQLSVAATLGIVLLLETSQSGSWWLSVLLVPFVAQIAVAPLLLHHTGTYSIVSPLANLVAAPLVELVMFGGIATLACSAIHPFLGDLAGAFTWVPARLVVATADATSSLRWSSSTTVTLSWPMTFLSYMLLVVGYLAWRRFVRDVRQRKHVSATTGSI